MGVTGSGIYHCLSVVFGVLFGVLATAAAAAETETREWGKVIRGEYCDYESFQPTCQAGELTLITSALYGHMRLGKCIKVDLGFLGCDHDVMNILDSKCTGKSRCSIDVDDESLRETQPCTPGIALYLDVEYACIKAFPDVCRPLRATSDMAYISSTQIFGANCNGRSAVAIHATPGQEVVITLVSLETSTAGETYGLVVGEGTDREVTVTSSGHDVTELPPVKAERVSVILDQNFARAKFMIGFQAVGCPEISTPADTVFKRDGNTATVSCIDSQQSWQLTCRGVHWLGVIGNCTQKVAAAVVMEAVKDEEAGKEWKLALSKEMIFIVTGCATLLASVLVITIGYVCLKKSQVKYNARAGTIDKRYNTNTILVKPSPDSDYLMPLFHSDTERAMAHQMYDYPLPEIPVADPPQTRGTMKKNNDDDYSATLSSTSTDYTRKYFVLDKDYMARNNMNTNA